jgi:hypothetical protein
VVFDRASEEEVIVIFYRGITQQAHGMGDFWVLSFVLSLSGGQEGM